MRAFITGLVVLGFAAAGSRARASGPPAATAMEPVCLPCTMPCVPDSCSGGRVTLGNGHLSVDETIHFDTGQATLHPSSYAVLDEVAATLNGHREIRKIRIEGYTDDVGDTDLNLRLSRQRADAVRSYLVKKGVDPDRLDAKGYGESRPISRNDTARGRQANRRVDFRIE